MTVDPSNCRGRCNAEWLRGGLRRRLVCHWPARRLARRYLQADIYASRCGGNVDPRYQEGWQSGDAMRPKTPYY